jgi:hypothetical protein
MYAVNLLHRVHPRLALEALRYDGRDDPPDNLAIISIEQNAAPRGRFVHGDDDPPILH